MYAATTVDAEEDPVELPACVELSELERDDAAKTVLTGAIDSNRISANRTEKNRVFLCDTSCKFIFHNYLLYCFNLLHLSRLNFFQPERIFDNKSAVKTKYFVL